MIRDNYTYNETVRPNTKEIEQLKAIMPQYFDHNGEFLLEQFKHMLKQEEVVFNEVN